MRYLKQNWGCEMDQFDAMRYSQNWSLKEAMRRQREDGRTLTPFEKLELRAHRGNAKEAMTLQEFQKLYGTNVLRDILGSADD